MLIVAETGISMFLYSVYLYYERTMPIALVQRASCPAPRACAAVAHNGVLFYAAVWIFVMQTWLGVLMLTQLWYIARQTTTWERSNVKKYGFMGGRPDAGLQAQAGYMQQQAEALRAAGHTPDEVQRLLLGRRAHRSHTALASVTHAGRGLLALVGLDVVSGAPNRAARHTQGAANPFDDGVLANCLDFWTGGQSAGRAYQRMYDVPAPPVPHAKDT